MILRPVDLAIIGVNIEFNYQVYKFLEIDLPHINKDGRSTFTTEGLAFMIRRLIDKKFLRAASHKEFGKDVCFYYVINERINKKMYKLVFCVCSDRSDSIGVITLHRIEEKA